MNQVVFLRLCRLELHRYVLVQCRQHFPVIYLAVLLLLFRPPILLDILLEYHRVHQVLIQAAVQLLHHHRYQVVSLLLIRQEFQARFQVLFQARFRLLFLVSIHQVFQAASHRKHQVDYRLQFQVPHLQWTHQVILPHCPRHIRQVYPHLFLRKCPLESHPLVQQEFPPQFPLALHLRSLHCHPLLLQPAIRL